MTVELLTQHHLEFLSLKEDCRGLSDSTLIKMPHEIHIEKKSFEDVSQSICHHSLDFPLV